MAVKIKYLVVLLLIISVFGSAAFAEEHSENAEDFNVTEMIMHHVKDSHEWHIMSYTKNGEEKHISIALPVILFCNGAVDVFLSSEFDHGKKTVKKNNNIYKIYHGKIYLVDETEEIIYEESADGKEPVVANKAPLDLSITRNVASMLLTCALLIWIFVSVARSYKKRPGRPAGLQAFLEPVILFIRDDIAIPNIGEHKYKKYLPYLLTLFFFILINNLIGLVPFFPGGSNVTGNIAVTLVLAVFTLIITTFSGNKNYWKHIFAAPGVPLWLLPIMIPVELIGVISKPFALMIRLFANITAGHIIVLSLVSLIFIFKALWVSAAAVPFVVFMDLLEVLVAFLQAYIFTMLTALFIGLAVQDHH